jgi:hypothetical protein
MQLHGLCNLQRLPFGLSVRHALLLHMLVYSLLHTPVSIFFIAQWIVMLKHNSCWNLLF